MVATLFNQSDISIHDPKLAHCKGSLFSVIWLSFPRLSFHTWSRGVCVWVCVEGGCSQNIHLDVLFFHPKHSSLGPRQVPERKGSQHFFLQSADSNGAPFLLCIYMAPLWEQPCCLFVRKWTELRVWSFNFCTSQTSWEIWGRSLLPCQPQFTHAQATRLDNAAVVRSGHKCERM